MSNTFLPREIPVAAERVIALGASPKFVQVESGRVVDISKIMCVHFEAQVGDMIVDIGSLKVLVNEEQFNQMFWKPNLEDHLNNIEDLIESHEFATSGSLTICILHIKHGRQVHGHCTRYVDEMCTPEEAEKIAYSNALVQVMNLESYVVQGQTNKVKK